MHLVACRVADVCFAHWPVDPDVLDTRLPHPLSPATREGAGWVSVLGMRTRPMLGALGLPGAFSQVTVRTYVESPDGREAVHFLRVDVDSRPVARGADAVFGVPFRHVDTSVAPDGDAVRVRTHAPGGGRLLDATFEPESDPAPLEPDSLAAWLTDRDTYALADGRAGSVQHDPWHVTPAAVTWRTEAMLDSEGVDAALGDPICRYSPGASFRLTGWPGDERTFATGTD